MTADFELHSLFLLLAAPFLGSFLVLLIARLPAGQGVVWGRSRCASCRSTLGLRDLVPVVSWLANRGRCRHCGAKVDRLYPAVELGAVVVALWSLLVAPGWLAWASCALGWSLLALAVIDAKHMLLPDALTLPLLPAGLLVTWLAAPELLLGHVLAAAVGFAGIWALAWIYRRARGREGIGLGDAKLLAAAGAWVGPYGLPSVLVLAAAVALFVALLRRGKPESPLGLRAVPFGAYLAAALWVVWLYGPLEWQ